MTIVDDTLVAPNGIALSPDGKHVYIGDTGTEHAETLGGPLFLDPTSPRTVYKFDRVDNGTHITGKRPIWQSPDWIPDGLKVAANGYVLAATGTGIDILDPSGVLIARVQTNYMAVNFAWVGEDLDEFWIVGSGGVSRVRWSLKGQDLANPTA